MRRPRHITVDPDDIVSEAVRRLKQADLIPPVGGLHLVGPDENEVIEVTIGGPIGAQLRKQIADVLAGLPHAVIEAQPTYGDD